MQEKIKNFINKISIKSYKRIVVVLSLICLYLLVNVIYVTIEYRKLWWKWQLSGSESIDSTSQIQRDTLYLSLCDFNKSLLDSPDINKVLITTMFMNADIVIPGIRIKVNEKELRYLKEHPINSLKGGLCAAGAWEGIIGTSKDSYYNNQADALRHAFWAACVAALTSPSEAQEILDNHENGGNDPMDAYNNKKGVEIGKALKNANPDGLTNKQIWDAVKAAFDRGELYCARCNPPIIPRTQPAQPSPQPSPQPPAPQPREHPDNHVDPADRNHGDRGNTDARPESRGGDRTRDGMPDHLDPVPRGGDRGDRGDRLPPEHGPLGFTNNNYLALNTFLIGLISLVAGLIIMFIIFRISRNQK
jgi:hypothetical protein